MGEERCIFQPSVQKFTINDAETLSCSRPSFPMLWNQYISHIYRRGETKNE